MTLPPASLNLPPNSYDAVPYPATAQTESHPDRLASLATLHGLTPAPVDQCRVLELGCSDGGNLLPMAHTLPHSQFLGLDFSAQEIASGQKRIAQLGLSNITLQQVDIAQVGAELGQFDYILACGVYSWLPAPVKEKLLEICQRHLAPQGVVYINYNTYPGWRLRGMVRDMLLYHTEGLGSLPERASEARGWLDFVVTAAQAARAKNATVTAERSAFVTILQQELAVISGHPDAYLCHEHLEDSNEPLYFYQFVERAARHGLQYLCEAEFSSAQPDYLPPEIAHAVQEMSGNDLIRQEQYLDFISNRAFRQTLLCHAEAPLRRTFSAEQLSAFWVASPILPESETPDLHSGAVEKFRNAHGAKLTAGNPVAKAALLHLSQIWPQSIPFDQLLATARARLEPDAPPIYSAERLAHEAQGVGEMLLHSFKVDLVELHVCPPHFTTQVRERPLVSPLARRQAQSSRNVINLRHEIITVHDEVTYRLLPYIDGQHDQAALLGQLAEMVQNGTLVAQAENGRPYADSIHLERVLETALEQALRRLANAALLVA